MLQECTTSVSSVKPTKEPPLGGEYKSQRQVLLPKQAASGLALLLAHASLHGSVLITTSLTFELVH